jgi:hypothetical protein
METKNAVREMIEQIEADPEGRFKTDREIAAMVGCSCSMVGRIRQKIKCGFEIPQNLQEISEQWMNSGEWRKRMVEKAIEKTLPKSYRNKNRCIFHLAVRLRGLFETIEEAKPAVELWYEKAMQNIQAESFDIIWLDFQEAWLNVEHPYYTCFGNAVDTAFSRLKNGSCLKQGFYTDDCFRLLLEVCRVLAGQSPDKTFFLSRRMAADIVDVNQWTAGNLLSRFCRDGFIERAGERKKFRDAQEYRWIWN